MALILNIDTATEKAFVSISDNEKILDFLINDNQKDHAAFLQPAIQTLLKKNCFSVNNLKKNYEILYN